MRLTKIIALITCSLITLGSPLLAQDTQMDLFVEQLRSMAPPAIIELAENEGVDVNDPQNFRIRSLKADLAGEGFSRYLVALYWVDFEVAIRVFRIEGQTLSHITDLDKGVDLNGANATIQLTDIEGNGSHEFVIQTFGARGSYRLSILGWTGVSLKLLNPDPSAFLDSFGNAFLEDFDHDGMLELIVPPARVINHSESDEAGTLNIETVGSFRVYKFNGSTFELDSAADFLSSGKGDSIYAQKAITHPEHYPLGTINETREHSALGGGSIAVRIGNLFNPTDILTGLLTVMDVDRITLVLDRGIRPVRTFIRPAEKGKANLEGGEGAGGFDGPFLELHFNRSDVLALLPRLKLTGPLEPCDVLTLEIKGKMIDGAPFRAFAPVTIIGPGGPAACEPPNANRPPIN